MSTEKKFKRFEPKGLDLNLGDKYKLYINIERYFIDAEWDGGYFKGITAIKRYSLKDSEGDDIYFWDLNEDILEYLSGKQPVDDLDRINLKNNYIDLKMIKLDTFPLEGTYYKNLKINKIDQVA